MENYPRPSMPATVYNGSRDRSALKYYKFMGRNLWKETRWPRWFLVLIISLLGLIWGINKIELNNQQTEVKGSILENSPIIQIQNSPNASVLIDYNDDEQIPLDIPIIMSLNPSSAISPNSDFLNSKFIFPDGKEAFIPRMSHDEEYIIAYRNNDCSDFYIPEKYKMVEEIQDEDICFIITIDCDFSEYYQTILGPRALDGSINRSDGGCIK